MNIDLYRILKMAWLSGFSSHSLLECEEHVKEILNFASKIGNE